MRNIGLLLEQGIIVHLRCNIDGGNLSGLGRFMDDIDARFPDKSHLSMAFASLFNNNSTPQELALYLRTMELNQAVSERGFAVAKNYRPFQTKTVYCNQAQHPDYYTVIAPNGDLYTCEHLGRDMVIGNVYEGITDRALSDRCASRRPVSTKCSGCLHLPKCTTFDMCPVKKKIQQCRERMMADLTHFLEGSIEKYKILSETGGVRCEGSVHQDGDSH